MGLKVQRGLINTITREQLYNVIESGNLYQL